MKHRFLSLLAILSALGAPLRAQPTLPTPSTKAVAVAGDDTYVLKYPTAAQFSAANPFPSIKILDSDSSHSVAFSIGSNITANRTVSIVPGDANRTITLTGNATVNQDTSTAGSPTFVGSTLSGATANTLNYFNGSKAETSVTLSGLTLSSGTLSVDAATDSAAGKVELATAAETFAGIDAVRAVTPAGWASADGQTRNSLSPRGGVMCDGTASAGFYQSLDTNAIASGPLSVSMIIKPPSTAPSGNDAFWVLGPNASGGGAVQTIYCRGESGGQLRILIFGASGSDYNRWTYSGFYTAYASTPVMVTFVRGASGDPKIYFNQVEVTAGGSFDSAGSAPTWQGTLSGSYLTGLHSGASSSVATVHALSIYNYAIDATKVARIYRNGGQPAEEDKWGVQANVASGSIAKLKLYLVVGGTSVVYNSITYAAGSTFAGVSGVTTYTETAGTESVYQVGALAYLPLDDGIGYQLHDQGTNKIDAVMTTTGMSHLIPRRDGFVRTAGNGLSWTATHEGKSVLGQRAFPVGTVLTDITYISTASSSGTGLTAGTTTTAAKWVASDTYTLNVKEVATLAARLPTDATDNQHDFLIDPDSANFTGTIVAEARYRVTEGSP